MVWRVVTVNRILVNLFFAYRAIKGVFVSAAFLLVVYPPPMLYRVYGGEILQIIYGHNLLLAVLTAFTSPCCYVFLNINVCVNQSHKTTHCSNSSPFWTRQSEQRLLFGHSQFPMNSLRKRRLLGNGRRRYSSQISFPILDSSLSGWRTHFVSLHYQNLFLCCFIAPVMI